MISTWTTRPMFVIILLVGVYCYSDELPGDVELLVVEAEPQSDENGPFVRNGVVYYREAANNINLMCIPPIPTDNVKWMRGNSLICRFEELMVYKYCWADATIRRAVVYETKKDDYEMTLQCKIGSDTKSEKTISFQKILPATSDDLQIQLVSYPDTHREKDKAEGTVEGVVVGDLANMAAVELRCSDTFDEDDKFLVESGTNTLGKFQWYHQGKLIKDGKLDPDAEGDWFDSFRDPVELDEKRFSFSGNKSHAMLINVIDHTTAGLYVCKVKRVDDGTELSQMFLMKDSTTSTGSTSSSSTIRITVDKPSTHPTKSPVTTGIKSTTPRSSKRSKTTKKKVASSGTTKANGKTKYDNFGAEATEGEKLFFEKFDKMVTNGEAKDRLDAVSIALQLKDNKPQTNDPTKKKQGLEKINEKKKENEKEGSGEKEEPKTRKVENKEAVYWNRRRRAIAAAAVCFASVLLHLTRFILEWHGFL